MIFWEELHGSVALFFGAYLALRGLDCDIGAGNLLIAEMETYSELCFRKSGDLPPVKRSRRLRLARKHLFSGKTVQ